MRTKSKNLQDNPRSSFNKALRFLSYRARSTKEINDYLVKNNFSETEITETIEKLIDYKFLDDREFSKNFINSRQIRGKSKRMISFELKYKGVNKDIAEQTLSASQEDIITAGKYIEKRIHQFEKLEPEKKNQRIISRLRSRGYNWDIIKEVLKI